MPAAKYVSAPLSMSLAPDGMGPGPGRTRVRSESRVGNSVGCENFSDRLACTNN